MAEEMSEGLMPTSLTFGSLFSGIGGIDLGLERAGMRPAWQVEIDDYASRVLAKHWPTVRRWRDVRTFPPEPASNWSCDLVAGGFPCQDISNAGKRAGIYGARSGLWSEFARVVRVVRPRYVLVENVAALLAPMRRNGAIVGPAPISVVLSDLAALGFDAEWHCIPAASVGAPHIRDRAFILANGAGVFGHSVFWSESHGNLSGHAYGRILADAYRAEGAKRESIVAHLGKELSPAQRSLRSCRAWNRGPFDDGSVDDGLSHSVDSLDGYGNAVVPQVAQWIGERIIKSNQVG